MIPHSTVTISRNWAHPEITTTVTNYDIGISMPLADFIDALREEIGSVALTFRAEVFARDLDDAVTRVLTGMKTETRKIV